MEEVQLTDYQSHVFNQYTKNLELTYRQKYLRRAFLGLDLIVRMGAVIDHPRFKTRSEEHLMCEPELIMCLEDLVSLSDHTRDSIDMPPPNYNYRDDLTLFVLSYFADARHEKEANERRRKYHFLIELFFIPLIKSYTDLTHTQALEQLDKDVKMCIAYVNGYDRAISSDDALVAYHQAAKTVQGQRKAKKIAAELLKLKQETAE